MDIISCAEKFEKCELMEKSRTVVTDNPYSIQPLVSVLLPVYNGGGYLAEAIESILSQTYRNIELIIINDGSTDDSVTTIERYNDPRIISIQQYNQGLAATLNRAVSMASGSYLARQDADDVSHTTRLEKQVRFLEKNPAYGLVGTWSEILDERSRTGRGHRHPVENIALCFNLLFDSHFVHSSVMFRKSVFDAVGLYSVEQSRQPEDFELWSRVLRNGSFKCANLPEILVCYREVPQSLCRSNSFQFLENVVTFCSENLAWAAGIPESDPTVTDIAALIHNAPRRLSGNPDLEAMLKVLSKAVRRICGTSAFDESDLRSQFQNRIKTVRMNYFVHRYGAVVGKFIGNFADFIRWNADNCNIIGSVLYSDSDRGLCCKEMLKYTSRSTGATMQEKDPGEHASIDVVIPVYNGERFIIQALTSVASQTCRPNRIIVVDDGSTDNTENLVRCFNSEITIDYIRKHNGGLSSARNAGIAHSCSSYVAFLDADDQWYPDKLQEQLKIFRNSKMNNLGIVYCEYCIIDNNGNFSDDFFVFRSDPSARGNVFDSLLTANKISGSGSGVLVKRECFDRVGFFDEKLAACEDWDMWLRLAEYYDFDFVPKNLVKIRRHQGNLQNNKFKMFVNHLCFYDKWLAILPGNSNCFTDWRRLSITYVATSGLNLKYYRAIIANLSNVNSHKLFSVSYGSVSLYLFLSLPMILLGMLKHAIWESYATKTKL